MGAGRYAGSLGMSGYTRAIFEVWWVHVLINTEMYDALTCAVLRCFHSQLCRRRCE